VVGFRPDFALPFLTMDITALPFSQVVGLARTDRPGCLLMLPADPRYTNHLGTVHAGALLTLAESASGEFLLQAFREVPSGIVPVVRRVEARFRKPARGAVYASASLARESADSFVAAVTNRGRASVSVRVDIHDEHDTHAVVVLVEWFISVP
jgi:acyl-coenzyme A thioesterase PaaI-like protein